MTSSTWHAFGNTYLVAERAEYGRAFDAQTARTLSKGTDGVIEVIAERGNVADVQIWNPDGSQAEFSGNGARIVAAWLAERTGEPRARIRFGAFEVDAYVHPGFVELDVPFDVGESEQLDLGGEQVTFTPVSVGNPHAVVRGDRSEIRRLGPQIENHPRFPERTNVQIVEVIGPQVLRIAIWERGAEETSASGSSSIAAAAAAVANGWCESTVIKSPVIVRQPGGALGVTLHPDGRATLLGPVEKL